MRTNVRDSSIEAYDKIKASGKLSARQQAVIDYLNTRPAGATRLQIAQHIGVYPSSITAAVKTLIEMEKIIEMKTRAPCPVTRENVIWLMIHKSRITAPVVEQVQMFGGVQ